MGVFRELGKFVFSVRFVGKRMKIPPKPSVHAGFKIPTVYTIFLNRPDELLCVTMQLQPCQTESTTMQTPDFIERPADGVAAVMCKQCRAIKPEAQFKRAFTPKQAQARGYINAFDVEYISSICHDCKPVRRKPLHELSVKEVKNLYALGRLNIFALKEELQRRKNERIEIGRESARKRWDPKHNQLWQPIMDKITAEIVAVGRQAATAKAKGINDKGFFDEYLRELDLLRMELKHRRRVAKKPPIFADWEAHFDDDRRLALTRRWHDFRKELVDSAHWAWVTRARTPTIVGVKYPEKPERAVRRRRAIARHERLFGIRAEVTQRTKHMVNADKSIYAKPKVNLYDTHKSNTEEDAVDRLSQIR